jgi:hypothetical protein
VRRNVNLPPEQTVDDVSRQVRPPVFATLFDRAQDAFACDLENRRLDFSRGVLRIF